MTTEQPSSLKQSFHNLGMLLGLFAFMALVLVGVIVLGDLAERNAPKVRQRMERHDQIDRLKKMTPEPNPPAEPPGVVGRNL